MRFTTFKKRWKLYELINKYPYKSSYDLAKMLKWKHEKIHVYLEKLLESKLIKFERYVSIDKKWGFYPTPWQELINWDEFNKKRD